MEDGITIGRGARVRIAQITMLMDPHFIHHLRRVRIIMLLLVHLAGQFGRLCKVVVGVEEEEARSEVARSVSLPNDRMDDGDCPASGVVGRTLKAAHDRTVKKRGRTGPSGIIASSESLAMGLDM